MCIHPVVARQSFDKMYPSFVAMQRLGKHIPTAMNTRNNRIVGCVCFGNQKLFEALFSMLSVPYQTKVGNYFFQELVFLIVSLDFVAEPGHSYRNYVDHLLGDLVDRA
jgi:hypothetical protein